MELNCMENNINPYLHGLTANPSDCSYHDYSFKYSLSGYITTGDLNVIDNENIRKIYAKGRKLEMQLLQNIN